jgi:senataxin
LNLKALLLNPPDNLPSQYSYFDIPEQLSAKMKSSYNFSQITAIKQCLKKEGVTLIQGPPGTGKTTTILGVLSVLLNSRNQTEKYKGSTSSQQKIASVTPFDEESKKMYYKKAMPWMYQDDYVDW